MKNIFFILAFFGLSGCVYHSPSITTGFEGKPMPSFNLLLMDSTSRINTGNIATGRPAVLFYFSPYCPFCRAETEKLVKNIRSFSQINFYLLSNYPFSTIKQYYDQYGLKKYPNIIVGQDYDAYFGNFYKAPGVPFIAVYQKDKKLQEVFMGDIDLDVVKNVALQK